MKEDRYPLAEKQPHRLKTPSGLAFDQITLEAVLAGSITMADLRVTPEALELQAEIARAAGRTQLAENLGRAAELARVPEDLILRIYNALRPGRATRAELERLAAQLEKDYQAPRCARLIREAAEAI
ncbi:MAG: diol dehydratase small subunit [Acidobacteriota bacterium]